MKIHGNTPGVQSGATEGLGKAAEATSVAQGKASEKSAAGGDQLTLSPHARAMQALAEAGSSQTPPIRQDVVDRMRELLDQGAIGNDADALANSIIEDLLKQS